MVSHDDSTTPTNPNILHHFLIPSDDPTNNNNSQAHFHTQNLNNPFLRGNNTTYTYQEALMFPTIQSLGDRISRSVNLVQGDESEMGHNSTRHHHAMDLFRAPNELSLSLATEGLVPPLPYKQSYMGSYMGLGGECTFMGNTSTTAFAPSYSTYLKPAQMLLEEVANVGGRSVELSELRRLFLKGSTSFELKAEILSLTGSSSPDKHQLQIKISRLIALLEQVECRYEEYCNQMGELVSSFEVMAGEGAAKTYTALALQAMRRHFRSLREAILAQINIARKKLYPKNITTTTGFEFDTQNRASLQQLGLMHQCQRQPWRPIRGLPETSVAILRAWLFEHFLHPYPNDSEKLILASQTGLTKNQVSNWFINARVRLWKPVIEEMYKEEFGESSSPGDSDALFSTREALPDSTPHHQ